MLQLIKTQLLCSPRQLQSSKPESIRLLRRTQNRHKNTGLLNCAGEHIPLYLHCSVQCHTSASTIFCGLREYRVSVSYLCPMPFPLVVFSDYDSVRLMYLSTWFPVDAAAQGYYRIWPWCSNYIAVAGYDSYQFSLSLLRFSLCVWGENAYVYVTVLYGS